MDVLQRIVAIILIFVYSNYREVLANKYDDLCRQRNKKCA